MQVIKQLDKKPSTLKYSADPSINKLTEQQKNDKKVEFKPTFLNPC